MGGVIPYPFYLNLNSLLVTRQKTLFHQGVKMGEKLVPRMHKRSEQTHNHLTFQRLKTGSQGGHSSP